MSVHVHVCVCVSGYASARRVLLIRTRPQESWEDALTRISCYPSTCYEEFSDVSAWIDDEEDSWRWGCRGGEVFPRSKKERVRFGHKRCMWGINIPEEQAPLQRGALAYTARCHRQVSIHLGLKPSARCISRLLGGSKWHLRWKSSSPRSREPCWFVPSSFFQRCIHAGGQVEERPTSASAVLMSARVFLFISGRVRARWHDKEIDLFIKKKPVWVIWKFFSTHWNILLQQLSGVCAKRARG